MLTATDDATRRVSALSPAGPGTRLRWAAAKHRGLLAVTSAFVLSAFLLPTTARTAINDDWIYTRSVEILLSEGRLQVLDITPATAFFQILWGAPFAAVTDNTFGALRVATVVFVLLSSVAFYGLCLELRLTRALAALGAALYLFSPLSYVLTFTFMTDPYFTGLLVIASYLYVRGLSRGEATLVVGGSAVAALALLQRAHGVLIPAAVVLYLLLAGRLRPSRDRIPVLAQVLGIPVVAACGLLLWLAFINGVSEVQGGQLDSILNAGLGRTAYLLPRISYVEVLYLGLFALPLLPAAGVGLVRGAVRFRRVDWLALLATVVVLGAGLGSTLSDGQVMPNAPQFVGAYGLGPRDFRGASSPLVSHAVLVALTLGCAAAFAAVLMLLCRQVRAAAPLREAVALPLVLSLGALQALASLVPSLHWSLTGVGAYSLDRYFLPLLPFAVLLGLVAVQRVTFPHVVTWAAAACMAVLAVAGTHDNLAFHELSWDLARSANAAGVPTTRLDGGYSWDAYHLYEISRDREAPTPTPDPVPYWIPFAASATDSSYAVSQDPLPGHEVVERRPFSPWLGSQPPALYLLRRTGASRLAETPPG